MHPFLDVTKLKDEEIIDRLNKAYNYMNSQKDLGHNPTVLSIKEIIQSLEDEHRSRLQKTMETEYNKKNPDSAKPIELGKLED